MKQTIVLDTNILLANPKAIESYEKTKIVLPFKVVEELDAHKTAGGQLGGNARAAIRFLDEATKSKNLGTAAQIGNQSTLTIATWTDNFDHLLVKHKLPDTPDNRIIITALGTKDAMLVSNDLAMRLKAGALGVKNAPFTGDLPADSIDEIYSGFMELVVSEEQINSLYATGEISVPKSVKVFQPNQYVHLKSNNNDKHTAIGRFCKNRIVKVDAVKEIFGIKPRNLEQVCAIDALLDDKLSLVSLLGRAGGGKSLCALAAALFMVLDEHRYKKMVLVRAPTSVGESVGWLPGSLAEKMQPHFEAFMDNLEIIFKAENSSKLQTIVDGLIESGSLEFTPPTFMRGRSLPQTLLIIDECQNLSIHEVKTIATRLGEGSKLILVGDLNQIDTPKLDALNNGFTKAIEAFKNQDCAAHITLAKCERSSFASLAAELL